MSAPSLEMLRQRAAELGFDLFGCVRVVADSPHYARFVQWLAAGHHGEMGYLAREPERRREPAQVLPGCKTIIMVGASYDQLHVPMHVLQDPSRGRIARYAWGADYHDALTPKLRELGEFACERSRSYVDTGPLLERAWAEACGLGFIGKNTCLINRERGSNFFLGAVLLADEIETLPAPPPVSAACACGGCTRCLVACPTQAFVNPFELDARRCISYLTIELKGTIPAALRPHMGNWIFGCDVCQDVCPYVRKQDTRTLPPARLCIDIDRAAPKLADVLRISPDEFSARFHGSPIKRTKWRGLMRNACVAAGNYGGAELIPMLQTLAQNADLLLREHALWAMDKITSK